MSHHLRTVFSLPQIICIVVGLAVAVPAMAVDIPDQLVPWKDWVLHDRPEQQCPPNHDAGNVRRCWWPSRLDLDLGERGGLFDQEVTIYAPAWVTLPGSETHWPESVTANNRLLPVVKREGKPCLRLDPGDYRIKGALIWESLPEMIRIPLSVGVLTLQVNRREIVEPDLDRQGRLRLHGKGSQPARDDAVTVTVFRLVEDDMPMRVVTRIWLNVSGRSREVRLAAILPDGGTPMGIDSPLPARLDPNGDLLVQARPGNWDIRVTVRMTGPVTTLAMGKRPYGDETWSFKAFNHLRMVNVSGAPTVEPSRTRMPDEWKRFPAYLLKPGAALEFETVRRGDPDPAPDKLSLYRSWWLDFNGKGYTVHDRINGTLSRSWHLSMQEPMQLGRVAVDGEDQLITRQDSLSGVQLRRGHLSLEADSRLTSSLSALPAVGWDHDFQQVRGVLHLPPGWVLFSAGGIDTPVGSWLQQWTLLDVFLTLIIAISAYKIRNRVIGLVALLALVLTFQEPGAPRYVWLHLLATAALLKFLPDNWFRRLIRLWWAGALIALIVTAIPFMVQQLRTAVYPQLAPHDGVPVHRPLSMMSDEAVEPEAGLPSESVQSARAPLKKADSARMAKKNRARHYTRLSQGTDSPIQTGPGLPRWKWRSVQLRWNGPVDRTQQIRLWLIPPIFNMILGFIRVGLLFLMILALMDLKNWRRHLPMPVTTGLTTLSIIVVSMFPLQPASAGYAADSFPPQVILDDLRKRLLEPPPCLPNCADISRLELTTTPDQLSLIMVAHAQTDSAIPLPATLETWRPSRISIDNESVRQLARDAQGALWMVLPEGVHRIKLSGPTGTADEIRIGFPIVPHSATFAGVGWQIRGIDADGRMDATILLQRVRSEDTPRRNRSKVEIPAFFQVTRTLHLGLQWEVVTQVRRLTEPGRPVVLDIPLLENASVTTAGIPVKDGVARISMGPGETESRFSARIPITPQITLTAPSDVPWAETWILDAATLWRCTLSGLTVIHHQDQGRNWRPQWRPWPGETVTIAVTRPEAVPGQTITVDRVRLTMTHGYRISQSELALDIRSSRGGTHHITLPQDVSLQHVRIDGKHLPIRQDGNLVSIPLTPGRQSIQVGWQAFKGSSVKIDSPQVDVGTAAVNANVTFNMPDQRWVLFVGGPRLGPAVLFWSYLIVAVMAAVALGKTNVTPLRTVQWLLLALGLTQIPVVAAVLVAGWLLALGFRCRWSPYKAWAFNGCQLLLAVWTVAALACLYLAVEQGLLGIPDMQIAGNNSTRLQLNWTQDRVDGLLPAPWVVSLPHWVYRLLMLSWALWLAFSLLSWLRWGWRCYSYGCLWRPVRWRLRTKRANGKTENRTMDHEGDHQTPD